LSKTFTLLQKSRQNEANHNNLDVTPIKEDKESIQKSILTEEEQIAAYFAVLF
jgi:hypothetical protein